MEIFYTEEKYCFMRDAVQYGSNTCIIVHNSAKTKKYKNIIIVHY